MPTGSHFVSELLQWCCFPPRSSVQGWRFWHRWKWWPDFLSGASQTCRGPPSYPGKQNSKTSDQCIQQNIRSVHSGEHQISTFRRTSDQCIQQNCRWKCLRTLKQQKTLNTFWYNVQFSWSGNCFPCEVLLDLQQCRKPYKGLVNKTVFPNVTVHCMHGVCPTQAFHRNSFLAVRYVHKLMQHT